MTSDFSPAASSAQDPLGYTIPLPLRSRWYPLGFPLEVVTNSVDILEAAKDAWNAEREKCSAEGEGEAPAVLRVHVTRGDGSPLPAPVMPRGQGHLISLVYSPEHFAVCDVSRGYAFASLTEDAARHHDWTRYHFLEPLGWLMIDALHAAPVHASCIAFGGRAVLLCGDAGSGKTTLAYACARRGWTFLSGDATHLLRNPTGFEVRGRPGQIRFRASAREMFPELESHAAGIRPSGKFDIETSPALLGLPVASQAEASHIVFLDRVPGLATPLLALYPRAAAAARLSDPICFGDEQIQAAQRETLERFLSLPLFRMRYSDPASAEAALRALVERGA